MLKALIWWVGQSLMGLFSLGFLVLGIDLCRASFHLKEPYQFILTFFASNLIILVSAALLAGLIVRIIGRVRGRHRNPPHPGRTDTEPPAPGGAMGGVGPGG
ncbi:MAG TPA: hypothetical protein VMU60_02790 [Syntrophobacteria bacterium]|nr:hypothetical protein [Syntrophobacteria bacterium]